MRDNGVTITRIDLAFDDVWNLVWKVCLAFLVCQFFVAAFAFGCFFVWTILTANGT